MLTDDEITELETLLQFEEAQKCIKDFYTFCVYMNSEYFTEKKEHLTLIAEVLQRVESGEIKKLMISLPPRSGKSYITSLFCAWLIGKHPEGSIMRNSYAAELAEKFSYDIREIVKSDKYRSIFYEVELRKDKHAVNDWAITLAKQSSYFCAGVGGPVTGKGCDLVAILDDPIKNVEDALSDTILDKTWQWYVSTHRSRLEKGCPEIQIATRWSNKDVIGKLLQEESEDWIKISVPALNENGETFCDEVKSTDEYLELKKIMEDFIWEAEFMQNPIEVKGLLFLHDELNKFALNELKDTETIVGYVDIADEGTDYLCSLIAEVKGDNVYIIDVVFTQEPIEITEGLVAQQIINNEPNKVMIESNAGGKSFARKIKDLIKDKSRTNITWKPNTQNKETRILMKSGQIKIFFWFRNDYLLGSDYDKYMRQLTSYVKLGKNKHDDAADATTGLAEMFEKKKVSAVMTL